MCSLDRLTHKQTDITEYIPLLFGHVSLPMTLNLVFLFLRDDFADHSKY